MKNLIKFVLLIAVIALVILVIKSKDVSQKQTVPVDDPIDVAMEFYGPWLKALQSTSTDPYQLDLLSSSLLTEDLRLSLISDEGEGVPEVDPVLCLEGVPPKIGGKIIFVSDVASQVMVLPRKSDLTGMAIVSMVAEEGRWVISDIECSRGEMAPEREFTFDYEGQLLKDSIEPPLNPEYWYLVFTQSGQPGHTAPLFFGEDTVCKDAYGEDIICSPDSLTETSKALVKGEMTESGVDVKQFQLLEGVE